MTIKETVKEDFVAGTGLMSEDRKSNRRWRVSEISLLAECCHVSV